MAPPRTAPQGWLSPFAILPINAFGSHTTFKDGEPNTLQNALQLLSQSSRVYDPIARGTDYVGESEAAGMPDHAECH